MKHTRLLGVLACLVACSREGEPHKADAAPPAAASPVAATPAPDTSIPVDTTPPANLDGTRWRLVEIQSMNDAQGATRPDDPAKYTMSFDTEGGFLAMQLDCNRVTGPYEKTRDSDHRGGTLKIGTLKVTRAQCPASLADRITRDMDYVRSYRFANGRLSLSLMADGGIYVWERDRTAH